MEKLTEILKQFKTIEPGLDFKKRSLPLILNTPQNRMLFIPKKFLNIFQFSAALGLASLLLMLIFGGISMLKPMTLTSLDDQSLNKELNDLDIKITLSEAKYLDDSLDKVAMILNDNLDFNALKNESDGLNSSQPDAQKLDEILNRLAH